MTDGEHISDELLNAYVDGELDGEDRRRIEWAMQQDSGLRERVDELGSLKQLVRDAYVDEAPPHVPVSMPRRRIATGLAASAAAFALGVGLTWGWISYTGDVAGTSITSSPDEQSDFLASAGHDVKVVFHISRNSPAQLKEMLNEAAALLATTSSSAQPVSVRIIASGSGLSLFGEESSPVVERIRQLKQTYRNQLFFSGCGLAYRQLIESQSDDEFQLLPEVQLVDLGVLELMRRQREGWAYIRL